MGPHADGRSHPRDASPVVGISQAAPDESAFDALERALASAGFWKRIDRHRAAAGTAPDAFRILIKPDLDAFDAGAPTGTDPALVEHLIDLLAERGFTNVAVAAGPCGASAWLENRDVLVLADLIGYRFVTEKEHAYDVLDLGEDVVEAGFPAESMLAETGLSRSWLDASFRISFAKSKTDEEDFYALGARNLLGVLPLRDKAYHYHDRLAPWDVCHDLLNRTPIHFGLIDAFVSNHGSQGSRAPNPLETRTLIASPDLLLADFVGALKMDLDPYASRLNGHLLRTRGLPSSYDIRGDLTPYAHWRNVSPALAESVRRRNENPTVHRLVQPWLQTVNPELFPFKHVTDAHVNATVAPLVRDLDGHPLAYGAYVVLNAFLATVHHLLTAWQTLYDKERIRRREVPLGIDLDPYASDDYEAVAGYILPLTQIVRHTVPDRNGLRWRYLDGSVLFEYVRVIPVPYDDFVAGVDIAAAVQMMYDNIGGVRVPVQRDEDGRILHQAERNIYLPQPNWMVLFGGTPIDVGKVETLRYETDRQQIFWRTVTSANDSAEFDDGMVTFARHDGGVEVRIVARQKFALPLIWQAIDLDYVPSVKDALVSDAYDRFFSRTLANYEAAYEGRTPSLGRSWDPDYGENGEVQPPLVAVQLDELTAVFTRLVEQWSQRPGSGGAAPETGTTDAHGYRHVAGTGAQQETADLTPRALFEDFSDALQKDIQWILTRPASDQP